MRSVPLISEEFRSCYNTFQTLCAEPELESTELSRRLWQNQLGRLRIWAANIAAHQTTQASLDHRLRDASHIKVQIVNLLQSIGRQIRECRAVLSDQKSWEERITPGDILPDSSYEEKAFSSEDIAELKNLQESIAAHQERQLDSHVSLSDLEECYNTVVNAIDCLYQASMIIRKPARHDRLIDPGAWEEASIFKEFDHRHVSDKFPDCDSSIQIRLGNAMTQRRLDLESRQKHQAKLRQGLEDDNEVKDLEVLSDTNPTEFVPAEDRILPLGPNLSMLRMSTTTMATSFIREGSTRIPPLPPDWDGEHGFECVYCNLPNVVVRNTSEWATHILKDLYPYVCLYQPCTTPNLMYDSSRAWFSHMLSNHINPPREVTAGVLIQEVPSLIRCPLCMEELRGKIAEKHIARHLQELALWTLPRHDDEEDDIGDDRDSGSEQHAEGQSQPHEDNGSVHSNASTVLTRASNIIPIDYIPGVTNRTPTYLPSSTSPAESDLHFTPPDLRDSTYSGYSDTISNDRSGSPERHITGNDRNDGVTDASFTQQLPTSTEDRFGPPHPADVDRAPPGDEYHYRVRAIYAYEADQYEPDEVSFRKHETLEASDLSGRWWKVRRENGETGIAPSNYLILL
ncbi:MAG: hypothetical protein Q9160_005781 [Pyrenula sp. 1 TL-2023]